MTDINQASNPEAMRMALGIYHRETEPATVALNEFKTVRIDQLTVDDLKALLPKSHIYVREFVFGKIEEAEYILKRVGPEYAVLFRTRNWSEAKRVKWADVGVFFLGNTDRQIVKIVLGHTRKPRTDMDRFVSPLRIKIEDHERFKRWKAASGFKSAYEAFAIMMDICEAYAPPQKPPDAR